MCCTNGKICYQKRTFCGCCSLGFGILSTAITFSVISFAFFLNIEKWEFDVVMDMMSGYTLISLIRCTTLWVAYCTQASKPTPSTRWCLFYVWIISAIMYFIS